MFRGGRIVRGTGPWTSREGVGDDVYNNSSDVESGLNIFETRNKFHDVTNY